MARLKRSFLARSFLTVLWTVVALVFLLGRPKIGNSSSDGELEGLAYVIAVHNERTTRPLERLLRALWRAEDTFVVHVDMRADASTWFLLRNATPMLQRENVHVVSWRANLYPKNEMVETSVDMIQYALEHPAAPWTHVIQLTGDSYPLQRPSVIQRLFWLQPNKTWIDSNVYEHKNARILECHKDEKFLLVPPERLRHGQSHWAFSRAVAEFLVRSQFARNLLVWCDCGEFQDEVFFQTAFHNSPWSEEHPDDRLMYATWGHRQDTDPPKATNVFPPTTAAVRLPRSGFVSNYLAPIAFRHGFLFARKIPSESGQRMLEGLWDTPSPYQPFLDNPYADISSEEQRKYTTTK